MAKQIRLYGGATAVVLDRINAVVTDDACCLKFSSQLRRRSSNVANSIDVRRRRSSSSAAMTPTMSASAASVGRGGLADACGSSASTKTVPITSMLDIDQKYYSKMPSILRQAMDLQVKITTLHRFRQILAEIDSKLNALNSKRKYKPPATPQKSLHHQQQSTRSQQKLLYTTLRSPFFKFEDRARIYCPVYKQFYNEGWPKITIRPGAKGCPFERRPKPILEENPSEVGDKSVPKQPCKPPRDKYKDCSAYCDLCQCWADNVDMHVIGDMHKRNASCKANYAEYDKLMDELPTLNDVLDKILNIRVPEKVEEDPELTIAIKAIQSLQQDASFCENLRESMEENIYAKTSRCRGLTPLKSPECSGNIDNFPVEDIRLSPVFRGSTMKRRRRHTVADRCSSDGRVVPEELNDEPLRNKSPFELMQKRTTNAEQYHLENAVTGLSLPSYINLPALC